jgi:hypothetical protein
MYTVDGAARGMRGIIRAEGEFAAPGRPDDPDCRSALGEAKIRQTGADDVNRVLASVD